MLTRTRLALALVVFAVSACGGDDPVDTADTNAPADTATGGDTSTDAPLPDDTAVADDATDPPETTDPCTPNPCTTAPAATCTADISAVQTYAATGTCSVVDGAPSCAHAVEATTPCAPDVCDGGACVSTVAACGYTFSDDVTYITELRLANVADDDSDVCCFDFDGDDEPDNKIGDLVRLIMGLPQVTADVNEVIADNVASGRFTLLMEVTGAAPQPADGAVDLALFYGTDTDDDHANNVAGEGTFTADLFSFESGTATPVTAFTGATVSGGALTAGPSTFRLRIPLQGGFVIEGDLLDARLEGDLGAGPEGGLTLDGDGLGAKLGGVFHQDQLFGALNGFVASTCDCLDTGTANGAPRTVVEKGAGGAWACNGDVDTSACDDTEGSDEAPCVTLVNVCNAALLFVQPDIDAVGEDGVKESLSVGLWLKGTGGALVGVQPDVCE